MLKTHLQCKRLSLLFKPKAFSAVLLSLTNHLIFGLTLDNGFEAMKNWHHHGGDWKERDQHGRARMKKSMQLNMTNINMMDTKSTILIMRSIIMTMIKVIENNRIDPILMYY